MRVHRVFLLSFFVLVFSQDAVLSEEETESDVENDPADAIIAKTQTNNRNSDDRDLDKDADFQTFNFDNNNSELEADGEVDKDAEDSSEEEDTVETTTVIPVTRETLNGRPNSSERKQVQPTAATRKLSTLGKTRQHPPTDQKVTKSDSKKKKVNRQDDPKIDQTLINNTQSAFNRKKHLEQNSTSQSAQLVILVVGAVLACVLITGFIRWRVRKRINERKLKKMSENYAFSRGRIGLQKKSLMETIYECECEQGLSLALSRGKGDLTYSAGALEDGTSRLDEDSSLHRFDKPPSCTYCSSDVLEHHSKSSKTGREHKHKSKHSRHHRRKSHETTHKQRMEATPLENIRLAPDNDIDNNCRTSLLEQPDDKAAEETATEQHPSAVSSPPPLLVQSSAHPHRGVLGSLLDSWRNLSFNRDWVGSMWLEKHNVRRISDVLRGWTTAPHPNVEDNPSENPTNCDGGDIHLNSGIFSAESSMLATIQDESEKYTDNLCGADSETSTDLAIWSLSNEGVGTAMLSERNLPSDNSFSINESDNFNNQSDISADNTTSIPFLDTDPGQISHIGTFHNFLPLNDQFTGPPGYESLLDTGRHSMSSAERRSTDHSRHHRKHRKKRSDDRDSNVRHVYRRVYGADPSHVDQVNADDQGENVQLSLAHRPHDLPSITDVDSHSLDTTSLSTSTNHSDICQEQNRSHNFFSNSGTSVGVSSVATPFVQQEGIVIEQLSDGAQIIYVPPPTLPSYYSDTPPPYQQEP